MKKILIASFIVILFSGCTATFSEEGKYDCEVAKDCTNSCSQGAVNSDWYRHNSDYIAECDDGCDGPWSDAPQCIENQCVAFSQGKQDLGCTNR